MDRQDAPGLPAQQTGAVYKKFLQELRQLTGASVVSLYLDADDGVGSMSLLVHSGHTEALPEFESISAVQQAVERFSNLSGQSPPPVIQVFHSGAEGGCLIQILVSGESGLEDAFSQEGSDRRQPATLPDIAAEGALWLGLRYEEEPVPGAIMDLDAPPPGRPDSAAGWLAHSLVNSANLLWEASRIQLMLRDPTSRLPGRAEFQFRLRTVMSEFHGRASFGLLLVNPDEFDLVNRRLDRDSGDAALAQVAAMLCDCLRRTDGIFRYGGAVFAVLVPGGDANSLMATAEKIRSTLTGAYLSGAMRLSFSIGAALYDATDPDHADLDDIGLLRRADQALNAAKGEGGDCAVLWQGGHLDVDTIGRDRLNGIFTANVEKDYRNMLVLWDVIAMVSKGEDVEHLAAGFVERIQLALRPAWVALFAGQEGEQVQLLAQSGRAAFPSGEHPPELNHVLVRARESGRTERCQRYPAPQEGDVDGRRLGFAIPLKSADRVLACLYLEGPEDELILDSSDQIFLSALTGQIALALDRADLAARWQVEQERESRRLRSEVQELRHAVQSARLVYSSRQMEAVLATARAAAPTDVTVLIRGESGTGKEMLARAVHEMSARQGKPFVTVDCGSIAANLIEAELFGAVKGAFTGAERASAGRIVQANGGTLFLDEIGEVPLDVQAKLLRFVQEKEIHPVGAATPQRVDVRIIAATNRDLAREAAAGRFREDLYFRLNVVALIAPPLRDRPDDILPLASHFLERFALQYNKGPRHFSAGAERKLRSYAWPGNVRELQNSILRAVVLSSNEAIEADQLVVEEGSSEQMLTHVVPTGGADRAASPAAGAGDPGESLRELAAHLDRQVEAALHDADTAPLGRWLSEDLVLTVDHKVSGIARRAAQRLGVAETTYRRQLEKAKRVQAQGLRVRSDSWQQLQVVIDHLAESLDENGDTNVMVAARDRLLQAVVARVGGDDAKGSALMGITLPTYRRWVERV